MMEIKGPIVIVRQSRMKLPVAIFCLLAVAKFGGCNPSKSPMEELTGDAPPDYGRRWSMELNAFQPGLKIKNSDGELVELTLTNDTLRLEALTRLESNVRFRLYTRENPETPDELSATGTEFRAKLQSSHFDRLRRTIFVTHGWMNDGNSMACTFIRAAFLETSDVNVIVVDWSDMPVQNYEYAALQAPFVGDQIARMILALHSHTKMCFDRMTLVGHSIGAHIMGRVGCWTNGQVDAIIGLDPAKPLFVEAPIGYRLAKSNAKNVQVIHTNAGHLGYDEPIGHADFYVNGGEHQFGCNKDFACSHSRAYEYYTESIISPDHFHGLKFDSYKDLKETINAPSRRVPIDNENATMGGYPAKRSLRGVYYVQTSDKIPYGLINYEQTNTSIPFLFLQERNIKTD